MQRQVDLGLDVVTDGEFARDAFTHSFYDAIEGIEPSPVPVRFRNAAGEKVLYNGVPRICGRLRKVGNPLVRDTDRLRSITERPFKVTLPAASWFLPAAFYEKGVTDRFYDSHDELLEDTLAIQRELIAEAIGAGARYVQLDFPNYVQLIDAGAREYAIRRQGIDPVRLPREGARARPPRDRGLPHRRDLRPAHLPRQLPLDVDLPGLAGARGRPDLQRAALRRLPRRVGRARARGRLLGPAPPAPGPIVALGIVSSKHPPVETREQLVREIEQAARHADVGQLAISPQCGFASVSEGNELSADDQWRKLEVVARTADEVWGPAG